MAKVSKVTIEKNRCKGCGLCVSNCPKKVLAMSREINDKGYFYSSVENQPACIGCRFCAFMCPDAAITIEQEDAA
jgi:2-oxoglutarate ferredoxin oxidoreductase subunit delta